MALKAELKAEEFDGLEENAKGFYKKNEESGTYRLDLEGVDFADELRGALKKERELNSNARTELAKLKKDLENLDQQKKIEKEQYKDLYESAKTKNEELQKQNESIRVGAEISKIVSGLTKDNKKSTLITNELKDKIKVSESGFDIVGIPITKLEEIPAFIKENYPFLVDGSSADGGGVNDENPGGKPKGLLTSKQVRELPEKERRMYFKEHGYTNFKEE